jgi:hypothetical protein
MACCFDQPAMHVKHTSRSSPSSSIVLLELVRCCFVAVRSLRWCFTFALDRTTLFVVSLSLESERASGHHYKSYSPSSRGWLSSVIIGKIATKVNHFFSTIPTSIFLKNRSVFNVATPVVRVTGSPSLLLSAGEKTYCAVCGRY